MYDVLSSHFDPRVIRELSATFKRETQRRWCESPVTLYNAGRLYTKFVCIARDKDIVGLYSVYDRDDGKTRVECIVGYDSDMSQVYATRNYTFDENVSPDTRLVFHRFDIATVRRVLINRGCGNKFVTSLLIQDVESAKSEVFQPLLDIYYKYSAVALGWTWSEVNRGNAEDMILERLARLG